MGVFQLWAWLDWLAREMAEIDKALLGFLTGLARRQYCGEEQFTDQFLREEVLGDMKEDEYEPFLRRYQALLANMVSADMDYTQLDAFLTSQMKKRQGALTEQEASTIRKFWKTQKDKIHSMLVSSSVWEQTLKSSSWRVDVRTKSRHLDQLNQPSAIVELKLGPATSEQVSEVVRFELDSDKLSQLLSQVEEIQKAVDTHMHV